MKFIALLFAAFAIALSTPADPARASIYDSNVMQELDLKGAQKREMQQLIDQSRKRRNAIFKEFDIDPNAKPEMSKLQRASSKLIANGQREKAEAKKILNAQQFKIYMKVFDKTRARVTNAALN